MSAITAFVRTINRINEWVGDKLAYLLFAFFLLILLQVILRYVFNAPTVWAGELSQMLFGAYATLSGGYIMRISGHVNVDIIYSRASERKRAAIDIFTSVLFFLFCGMLLVYGGSMAWESVSSLETSGSAWDPPIYPIRLAIPLAALLLLIQGVAKLIVDICILSGVELEVEGPKTQHHAAAQEESL